MVKDMELLQRQVEELTAANDKLDKSKKKIAAELEDANIDLETQRQKVAELEKKQKNFDKVLAEEKAVSEQMAAERDAAEREAREKETRVLSLSRELDESSEKIEELERVKRQLQAELDELVNNQGIYIYLPIFSLIPYLLLLLRPGPHCVTCYTTLLTIWQVTRDKL